MQQQVYRLSRKFKTVSFGPGTKHVPVRMYGSASPQLSHLPEGLILYNSFGREDKPERQVILRIKEDAGKIHERMCLSEHPFEKIKWYHRAHYLLCRGKEKVTAELGLSFLAYNMKRAINLVGARRLIEAMQG